MDVPCCVFVPSLPDHSEFVRTGNKAVIRQPFSGSDTMENRRVPWRTGPAWQSGRGLFDFGQLKPLAVILDGQADNIVFAVDPYGNPVRLPWYNALLTASWTILNTGIWNFWGIPSSLAGASSRISVFFPTWSQKHSSVVARPNSSSMTGCIFSEYIFDFRLYLIQVNGNFFQ